MPCKTTRSFTFIMSYNFLSEVFDIFCDAGTVKSQRRKNQHRNNFNLTVILFVTVLMFFFFNITSYTHTRGSPWPDWTVYTLHNIGCFSFPTNHGLMCSLHSTQNWVLYLSTRSLHPTQHWVLCSLLFLAHPSVASFLQYFLSFDCCLVTFSQKFYLLSGGVKRHSLQSLLSHLAHSVASTVELL